ncbi:hypothetical protein ACQPZX_19560 [Actinoplanes sp. CA-142083]|uniref:hypothetical protein n=1 Tax=Actinoplanes sp. CA-142083 TaxID=3239903 RepID=UPI003D8A973D
MRTSTVVAAAAVAATLAGAGCTKTGTTSAAPASAEAPSLTRPSRSAPSATAEPTATPRAIPSSIPDAAFLQASDVPGKAKDKPRRLGAGDQDLPVFCDTGYYTGTGVGVRATQSVFFVEADAPPESTPKAAVYEDVLVFKGDGATTFMSGLRAAVQGCGEQKYEGVTVKNYLRGEVGAGDESVLIERTRPATDDAGEPVGGGALHHLFWAAVRVGDSVGLVSNTGWESVSADRADTVHLGGKAAARLAAWRG